MNRTSLIVVVCLALAIVLGIGGVIWWWRANADGFVETAKQAYAEGKKMGADLDESGCLAAAIAHHKIESNRTLFESTRNGVSLAACLHVSKLSENFCEEVPPAKNIIEAGVWSSKRCVQSGLTDSYCGSMMQQVVQYCGKPARAAKVKNVKNAK